MLAYQSKTMLFIFALLACRLFESHSSIMAEETTNLELFKQLDQNGDGVVAKSEMSESQLVYFERLLRIGDKNKDGRLTTDEMNQGLKEPQASENLEIVGGPGGRRPEGNPEQMFQFMDRNQDGKLQRTELPEMAKERLGKLFDFLGKEELTKDEYMQIVNRMQGPGMPEGGKPGMPGQMPRPSPEQLTMMLERMDQNNDGKVSPAEVPERAKPMLSQMQRRLGLDESQAISIKDIQNNFPASGGKGDDQTISDNKNSVIIQPETAMKVNEMQRPDTKKDKSSDNKPKLAQGLNQDGMMLKQLDKNGDGTISKDEAPERMKQFFDRIDQNNDGKLSTVEVNEARAQREKK